METMRTRSKLIPGALALGLGAVALGACSQAPSVQSTSNGNATGTSTVGSAPDDTATTAVAATEGTTADGQSASGGNASSGQGATNGGGSGGATGGGGGGSTAPVVTSATGPGTAACPDQTSLVTITAHYSVANAKYVEYLQPGATRPGAGPASGTVMLNFDCSKTSAVYKIRAFNEFNGSDSKNPSPYVSFTVTRKLTGSSSSSSSSTSTSTSTGAPTPHT
jgi:hypothetical protein